MMCPKCGSMTAFMVVSSKTFKVSRKVGAQKLFIFACKACKSSFSERITVKVVNGLTMIGG